jgi:2',3'-cyclic-nucleotide 2'-phosphodiesterase (5'-nucleotidase family)
VIESLPNLSFLKRNDNPIGQSNVMLCSACCQLMTSKFIGYLCMDQKVSTRTIFYISTF